MSIHGWSPPLLRRDVREQTPTRLPGTPWHTVTRAGRLSQVSGQMRLPGIPDRHLLCRLAAQPSRPPEAASLAPAAEPLKGELAGGLGISRDLRYGGGGAPGSLVGNHRMDRAGEVGGVRGVETVLFLVVLGTVVAAFAGRLRLPAPSLLVIAGLVIGLLPGVPPIRVPPDVVSLVVLPPLLYAASEELPWRDLRAVWRPVACWRWAWCWRPRLRSPRWQGRWRRSGEHGVCPGRGAGQHGPGGGQRARAAAVTAGQGSGAGAGGKPVQRRDQPGAVPDSGLRRGRRDGRRHRGGTLAARRWAVRGPGGRRRGSWAAWSRPGSSPCAGT